MFRKVFRIIVLAALVFTIGVTVYSCAGGSKQENIAESLPQITNKEQLQEALVGEPQVYACLNIPITGGAAKDRFNILTDDYICIMYIGEEYVEGSNTDDNWKYYKWEGNGDDSESMADSLYAFDDIPISLKGASFDNPDFLDDASEVDLSDTKNAAADTTMAYFYPYGDAEAEGNIRYRVYFVKSGIPATFLGMVGDNKISVYSADEVISENADDTESTENTVSDPENALQETNPTVWIGGDMSDLIYLAGEQDTGSVIMCWIGFLFIGFVYLLTPEKE